MHQIHRDFWEDFFFFIPNCFYFGLWESLYVLLYLFMGKEFLSYSSNYFLKVAMVLEK
jgi:hypothetical protein